MLKYFGFFAALFGLLSMSSIAMAGPALQYTGGNTALTNTTVGWGFTTNQTVTVDALDSLSPNGGTVVLYNAYGTILASATITSSDPTEGVVNSYYSAAISPVSLLDNTEYFIAQQTTPVDVYSVASVTTNPAITYDGGVFGSGLPTSDGFGGFLKPGYFAANFDIQVPEPGSLALLGTGLLGLALVMRKRRKRA